MSSDLLKTESERQGKCPTVSDISGGNIISATPSHEFVTPTIELLANARKRAYTAVNFAMAESYWLPIACEYTSKAPPSRGDFSGFLRKRIKCITYNRITHSEKIVVDG